VPPHMAPPPGAPPAGVVNPAQQGGSSASGGASAEPYGDREAGEGWPQSQPEWAALDSVGLHMCGDLAGAAMVAVAAPAQFRLDFLGLDTSRQDYYM